AIGRVRKILAEAACNLDAKVLAQGVTRPILPDRLLPERVFHPLGMRRAVAGLRQHRRVCRIHWTPSGPVDHAQLHGLYLQNASRLTASRAVFLCRVSRR